VPCCVRGTVARAPTRLLKTFYDLLPRIIWRPSQNPQSRLVVELPKHDGKINKFEFAQQPGQKDNDQGASHFSGRAAAPHTPSRKGVESSRGVGGLHRSYNRACFCPAYLKAGSRLPPPTKKHAKCGVSWRAASGIARPRVRCVIMQTLTPRVHECCAGCCPEIRLYCPIRDRKPRWMI